jgi:Bacterial regulatory proteins, tetR family
MNKNTIKNPLLLTAPIETTKMIIIKETINLLKNTNIHEITMQMLADKCSIQKPSIFHHYPTAEKIFETALRQAIHVWFSFPDSFFTNILGQVMFSHKFKYIQTIIIQHLTDKKERTDGIYNHRRG